MCKMSRSWNRLVRIATPLWSGQLRNRDLIPSMDKGFFLFVGTSRLAALFIQPPIRSVLVPLSLGIKKLRHEADHLPLSTIEVKNKWNCTFTPPCAIILCRGMILPLRLYKMLSVKGWLLSVQTSVSTFDLI